MLQGQGTSFHAYEQDWANHWNDPDQALKGKPFPQIVLPYFQEDSYIEDEGSKTGEQWVSLVLLPAALEVSQVLSNLILGHF